MRRILPAACAALMMAGSIGPAGAADPTTTVNSLSATASGSAVEVTGTATFVDAPRTVGTDPTGDSAVPLAGTDIASAVIARAPGSNQLTFTLGMANLAPTGGQLAYVYHWNLSIDGETSGLALEAARGKAEFCGVEGVTTEPIFRLVSGGFTLIADLTGSFADNKVTFQNVPLDKLGATTGSVIGTADEGVVSTVGVAGCGYFFNLGGDQIGVDDYVVPGANVQLGIAPGGTPEGDVMLTTSATLGADGTSFSGSLPTPATAGPYILVARACYVPDLCGLRSTTLTI